MQSGNRSPIVSGRSFSLPYSEVVVPRPQSLTEDQAEGLMPSAEVVSNDDTVIQRALNRRTGPVLVLNRFHAVGIPFDRKGIQQTVLFSKRPVENVFTISDDYKVSGYLSYSYLMSGSVCVGLVFHSDNSLTRVSDYKLVVSGQQPSRGYVPNFNLEKMGVIMFVAEDSSVLVVPTDIESSMLVRTDA